MKPSDLETIHQDPVTACIQEIMEAGVKFAGEDEDWTITICHPVMRLEAKICLHGLEYDYGEPMHRDCDGTPPGWDWDSTSISYTMASKYTDGPVAVKMSRDFNAAIIRIILQYIEETVSKPKRGDHEL